MLKKIKYCLEDVNDYIDDVYREIPAFFNNDVLLMTWFGIVIYTIFGFFPSVLSMFIFMVFRNYKL